MELNEVMDAIALDRSTPVPLYHQLSLGIRSAISEGLLKPGDKLPPIHQFAAERNLTVATVSRAFTELAREGLVISRRGMGTVVARRIQRTTEILIYSDYSQIPPDKKDFFYQIVDGLRKGYDDPDRRFAFSHFDKWTPHPHELLEVARIRKVDGMVIYRPWPSLEEAIKIVSAHIPTVTLFAPIRDSSADVIIADPIPQFQKLLSRYYKAGARNFAYIGQSMLLRIEKEYSPYIAIYNEFRRFADEAGLEPEMIIPEHALSHEEKRLAINRINEASRDAVIVAADPEIANAARKSGRYSSITTYTETRSSLEMAQPGIDILYMGLEYLGRKAVETLRRRRVKPHEPQNIIALHPVIHTTQ